MGKAFGLVLSGGGARGIAHIGVLQALNELGYSPSAIAGTSAGALTGAFYAAGVKPADILQIFEETSLFGWSDIAWNQESIFRGSLMQNLLQKRLPVNTFEELQIPLAVCATNFSTCRAEIFRAGELLKPLLASSAIPAVFHSVDINGIPYYDGGLSNNMPANMLTDKYAVLIGVHVNALSGNPGKASFRSVIERSFHIMINNNVAKQASLCDLLIEPMLTDRFGMFDMDKGRQIYEAGYAFTMTKSSEIRELLEE